MSIRYSNRACSDGIQTHGDYPGATPPLEWWEGTPTTKKVKVGDSKSSREVGVPDIADQKSKNILWKMPVPGWGLSHPIVVGKRVFAVGDMDFVPVGIWIPASNSGNGGSCPCSAMD